MLSKFFGFALSAAVAVLSADEAPQNVVGGVALPMRAYTNIFVDQRIEIHFDTAPGAYFQIQYSGASSPTTWKDFQDYPTPSGLYVDEDGVNNRTYRAVGVTGHTTHLTLEAVRGQPVPGTISLSSFFYPSWAYFLEQRPVAAVGLTPQRLGDGWQVKASSTTNAHFLAQRQDGIDYRIRAVPPIRREDFEAILVGGQSNALLNDDVYFPSRVTNVFYLSAYADFYCAFLNPSRFHDLKGPFAFSFSVGATTQLADSRTNRYLLVPVAAGGTAMKQWMPGSNRFDQATLFGKANYRRVLGTSNQYSAFWYYGHESSAFPLDDYIPDWQTLISEFRKEVGPVPLIYAQIAKNGIPASHELARLAADRQRLTESGQPFVVPDSHMVVTFDLPLADGLHLSAEGQQILGHRFALAMREHVYHENVNGTGPRLVGVTRRLDSPRTVTVKLSRPVNTPTNDYDNQFRLSAGGYLCRSSV